MPTNLIPDLDPDKIRTALSALAGGFVYGVYHLVTLALSGRPLTWADYARAALNMAAAMLCGAIVAYFVGVPLATLIPWPALRDLTAVGFVIGALGWEIAPFVLKGARKKAAEAAGVQEDAR